MFIDIGWVALSFGCFGGFILGALVCASGYESQKQKAAKAKQAEKQNQ